MYSRLAQSVWICFWIASLCLSDILVVQKLSESKKNKLKGCSHVEVLFSHDRKKKFYFNKKIFLEG
jgi:hypothetical protein